MLVGSFVPDTIDDDCKRSRLLILCLINKERSYVFFGNKYFSRLNKVVGPKYEHRGKVMRCFCLTASLMLYFLS